MATLLRWLGGGKPSQNHSRDDGAPVASLASLPNPGRKRSFLDLTGNDENENEVLNVNKRAKRAFVDISLHEEDDIITVAHPPLGEANVDQLANRDGELSEKQFASKARRKLWVKPQPLTPDSVAEYSVSTIMKSPVGSSRKTIQQASQNLFSSAVKSKSVSLDRPKSKALKDQVSKASKYTDLRKMFGLSIPSSHTPGYSEVVVYDDDFTGTPPAQIATASAVHAAGSTQRRSGRAALKSYADMDLAESSEDEFANASPKRISKRKARSKDADDDDFMADEDGAASEVSDEAELAYDLGEFSSDVASPEEDDEDEKVPRAKSGKRGEAKMRAKNDDVDGGGHPNTKAKKSRLRMVNLKSGNEEARKINHALPPLFEIEDIFQDITNKALKHGLDKVAKGLNARPIRVATMCSGTESPLLALEMIKGCLVKGDSGLPPLEIEHLFSAEIVPFKQAYIERNFNPPIIFRDITELTSAVDEEEPVATTAYGGRAPVPKAVDLVIAGTSCVDFSGLNSHQKDLDDGGESADTWNAVLSYCRAFRPAIVLLENVSGADWDRMLADYEKINYECSGAMVNTRDFYIPQVRERGYMACFNRQSPGFAPGSADKWVDLMEKFKRQASSPVSDFLIPNDQIIRAHIRTDEPTREFDWAQCEITQMEYRQDLRLGWARPITHWEESGSKLPPDNGNSAWYHKQVERVLDTIDGAVLRKALHMYDCRFKTRIFDLSQNIYRETDHRPFGISGCITPSGIYFVTDLGRVITPEETLKLQGIPLDKISFTTEQPSEIQSLAGNAMSSTVIAASILSALIPGHTAIDTQHREPYVQEVSPLSDRNLIPGSKERSRVGLGRSNECFDLATLLQKAEKATRRCYCEGSLGIAERPIQQCKDCGHTTCTSCGGNPIHNYQQNHHMSKDRVSPAGFRDYVHSVMPLQVSFSSFQLSQFAKLWPSDAYGKAAAAVLGMSFSFASIRRTHCWTISYTSEGARLDLVISPAHAQWRLYTTSSKNLPNSSALRTMLAQPVARSALFDKGSALNVPGWSLRIPKKKAEALPLTIAGSGAKVASWWSRMEMPDFKNHSVSSILDIEAGATGELAARIGGKYQYLANCGKACNSLYKKIGCGSDQPVYFFLDPTRTGEPEDDCFVFSESIDLLEKDEPRPIIARVASSWRPWASKGKSEIDAQLDTKLLVDESWHNLPGCNLAAREMELEITRSSDSDSTSAAQCSKLAVLLACNIPSPIVGLEGLEDESIVSASDPKFFNVHAWAFEAMRRHLPTSAWKQLHGHSGTRCESCAPLRPAIRWGLSEDGKDLKPYEDPREAAMYERAMKARQDPIAVAVAPENGGFTFSILLDVAAIAHRAGARLPRDLDVSYQWRFVTGAEPEFKPKAFKLRDTRGIVPHSKDLHMSIELFPQQLTSLAWMKRQEKGIPFILEEGEEALISSLGWRAEVRASATKTIRGGICADHPGFGKTITSLALIHSEWRELTAVGILEEMKPRANGALAHAGTLIVCPASLIDQWFGEIRTTIGEHGLCVLRTIADLTKHTISGFRKFKIVLVNRTLLSSDAYIERLAAFAAIPGPVTNKGRPFAQWLKFAHEQMPAHLEVMERDPKGFKGHIEKLYRDRVNSEEFKAAVPSKRLTGASYIAGKAKKGTTKPKMKAQANLNVTHLGKPLLEMFYWNRIIVDEFHQPEAKAANVAVAAIRANKRWGLSATPAIGDFYEVSKMAELIGVPLRIGSDRLGIMKSASVRELRKDMTNFELFDAMRQITSDSMHNRIHEVDQQFLNTFVRQNIMDDDRMPCRQHLIPVALDLDHRALVAELSQHLNSSDMRIKKKNSKATDRDKRFNEAVSTSTTAEEALSKVAAFSNRGIVAGTDGTDELNLQSIVQSRQAAVDVILRELPVALSEAKGTEAAYKKWAKSRLEDGTIGDAETSAQILTLARAEKGVKLSAAELKRRGKSDSGYGIGKRALTAYLNGLCNRLLAEKRSARYMQNLYRIQQPARDGSVINTCDHPECECQMNSADVAVSALCGHAICRSCYQRRKQSESILCPGLGCSSPMADHHLFWPSKVGDLGTATPYGAKINAAMKLLDEIKGKDEQALLFVQFANQLDEIETALRDHGHSAIVVKTAEKAGTQIAAFRQAAGTKQQTTVLVLNSSDETAAGFNLQNANHVIFLSPLLKDTPYGYDSTMAQTIGRVRRHGQKKEIHIYRIVALCTVDVDILEQRERRIDALVEKDAAEMGRPAWLAQQDGNKKRTQLVRENGRFSLRPQSWLVTPGSGQEQAHEDAQRVKGRHRVLGWEDFSSLVKFSRNFTEDDDDDD